MAIGLYSGVSGLALGTGLYRNVSGLWGGASGLINGFGGMTLNLDFLNMTALPSTVTFTRGSNATLTDSTGKITYAPANLLLRSQEFDNAAWTKSNATVAANTTTAPDGTGTADTLLDTAVSNIHYAHQPSSTALANGNTVVMSVYAKAATLNYVTVGISDISVGSVYAVAVFNLANGTVATSGASGTGYVVGATTITPVGNGWYRCSVACTIGSSVTFARAAIGVNKNGTINSTAGGMESYLGNGSGIFIWGAQLEPVTYQTTPGAYVATTSAAYYGPRFDYDPVTLAPKGLLTEEQRTNLATYSDQFDNAAWAKTRSSVSANSTTSPDGTSNADTLIEDTTATSTHFIGRIITASASTTYTQSIFVKAAGRTKGQLQIFGNSGGSTVLFDLTAVTATATGAYGGWASASATITSVGSGWYRITNTATTNVGLTSLNSNCYLADAAGNASYTGDGTSGFYLYGAQLEAGAFATSYIPTVASTVTRSADVATMTGTNFSNWYNQSEGTFVVGFDYIAASNVITPNSAYAFFGSGATAAERLAIYNRSGFKASGLVQAGGVTQTNIAISTTQAANVPLKAAFAFKVNDFAISADGSAVVTSTSGSIPTIDRFGIGSSALSSSNQLNGHVRTLQYYNTRLPNAQLQALTT